MSALLTPAEAERLVLSRMPTLPREDCPLRDAHGRVLRENLAADRDFPPFDRVAMDGFALRSSALRAGVKTFQVGGVQGAGMVALTLRPEPGACVEVMTGAVLPGGADCVVPYEDCSRDGTSVTVNATAGPGSAVHARASDHRAGDELLRSGMRLSGREIAVAAAIGRPILSVSSRPRIAVVATGDELVDVDMAVAAHQIRRSNDYALRAALLAAGYPRVDSFHLRDVEQEIEHRLWHILAEFDVLVLCGGVSKGKYDHLPKVLASLGAEKVFQGIAQRPGKPFWFGLSARKTPIFALPGNPVSAYTCLHRYVVPALAHASGAQPEPKRQVRLAAAENAHPKLTYYVPVRLGDSDEAGTLAMSAGFNTSGDFASLVGTDGFVEIPPASAAMLPGAYAPFRPWN